MVKIFRGNRLVFGLCLLSLMVPGAARAQKAAQPIQITVDLREAPRRIFHARMVVPAAPGPLALLYPKWIPGEHGPTGPITNLAGLKFTAAGKPLQWHRDDVDMYLFRCQVPSGASSVEVELDYLSPVESGRFSDSPVATAQLAVLNWNLVTLYPQGPAAADLTYAPRILLPEGWKFGTALRVAGQSGATVEFSPVALYTLIDSPVLTSAHFRVVPLPLEGGPSHEIDLAGDSDAAIAMSPELQKNYTQLVAEAHALFGAHHYREYHFLFALSDHLRSFGLEHHESSDDRLGARALLDDDLRKLGAGLLPHEFVHSWNAKYRRPAGLTTPDYEQPMKGELLWVYEGLTEYLGEVLTARSGLLTRAQMGEELARVAGYLDHRPGRTWRPLADTAVAAQTLYTAPSQWASWRRGVDFYDESTLIWLEADVNIRRLTQGKKSLDDFCKRFYGAPGGPPEVKPYTFDDLVAALNEVAPYNWREFFTTRVGSTGAHAPLGGIEGSGWRLVYNDTPNEIIASGEDEGDWMDLTYSLGLFLIAKPGDSRDGIIVDVIPGMPAAQAGLAPGMKLLAVNGRRWSADVLREALRAAKNSQASIELLVENAEFFKSYALDYHDGEKYPHLERDPSKPDLLGEILKPHVP